MALFNPQKLSVNLIPPATWAHPVEGRKYTLTHSDSTGQLFLDIGYGYNGKAIDPKMRDEVLAEWIKDPNGRLRIAGTAYVDGGEFSQTEAEARLAVFKKEMATALKGMINGDRPFYANYPFLLNAPIYIQFLSAYPQYRQVIYYGTPRQYLEEA
ncbi:staygreen family protein [Cohnella sp. AR92]|uniref:staygreen family protein n=1 Tax=Cohnella sp. AR92 TaxID=648716 RepID=UPI000F8CA738|nr:staygreen family protein [Cohnella sp. AR92]RUS48911.1 hypothetical protein ELR57_00760 [Cohnella sp. AR92]